MRKKIVFSQLFNLFLLQFYYNWKPNFVEMLSLRLL